MQLADAATHPAAAPAAVPAPAAGSSPPACLPPVTLPPPTAAGSWCREGPGGCRRCCRCRVTAAQANQATPVPVTDGALWSKGYQKGN